MKLSRRSLVAGGLAVLATGTRGRAQTKVQTNAEAISASLAGDMARLKVPAVSYAFFEPSRIVADALGVPTIGATEKVTTETIFQGASLSKTIAGAIGLIMHDRREMRLDAEIRHYLGDWKLPSSPLTKDHPVTLRRLLGMTAGINVPGYLGYAPQAPLPDLRQILDGTPPANSEAVRIIATPGTKEIYSGGGYQIAQLAIQNSASEPFVKLAERLVLGPLGMRRSSFAQPLARTADDNVALGHDSDGALAGGGNVFPELAAAGLSSTPSDLARFLLELGASFRGEPHNLILSRTMREMMKPVDRKGYGIGAAVRGRGKTLVLMKRGHNLGFHSYMMLFPEAGQGAVVMTNAQSGKELIEPLLRAIAAQEKWPKFGKLAD